MNYTENNQETTEKPRLSRDYPPAQLKRSEWAPSKGHSGPRWYRAAGKHNSQCSIFRRASLESISLEDTVVNNRQCLQWECKVSALVHHTLQHTSAEPCKWANRGTEEKFLTLFFQKPQDKPVQKKLMLPISEWRYCCLYFVIIIHLFIFC